MTPETDRLLHYMPIIARAPGIDDWERKFCIGMQGRRKRNAAFEPSEKQIGVMRRIVQQFQASTRAEQVVERP